MPDTPSTAQITYTTNPILSPTVLGGLVTLIVTITNSFGLHVLDDPQLQQTLVLVLGLVGTTIARYLWPQNDGRLSFNAPLSTPAPIAVPIGASVVTVPSTTASSQSSTVQPLTEGATTVVVPPRSSDSIPQPAPLVLGGSSL